MIISFSNCHFLSYDAKEYYHFSEVVDEFCKKGVDYFESNVLNSLITI
jgi:hypothetical protein